MIDCPHYDDCDAPLCPLDPNSLKYGIWYPDEEICRKRGMANLTFIKMQKKIAKACNYNPDCGFFTYEMLNKKRSVGKAMRGIDPDKPEGPQMKKWFKKHPERKELSPERKKELKKKGEKLPHRGRKSS